MNTKILETKIDTKKDTLAEMMEKLKQKTLKLEQENIADKIQAKLNLKFYESMTEQG